MTKEIFLVERVDNGDGTVNLIAEIAVFNSDGSFRQDLSRSPFTFDSSLTDQEIKDYLIANQYSIYYT
jgi:hypothetical protein